MIARLWNRQGGAPAGVPTPSRVRAQTTSLTTARTTALTLGLAMGLALPAAAKERVLALGGAVTEIVVALGAEDRLAGRDTTSTYPARIEALPDVGYLRRLAPEGVLALAPDLILADASAGPPETMQVLTAAGVHLVPVPGEASAQGVLAKIRTVAQALDLTREGEALSAKVQQGFDAAAAASAVSGAKKRVLFVLSLQGGRVMAAGSGTEAQGILQLAGAENAVQGFAGYKQLTDEAVLAAAPDVILMMDREGAQSVGADEIRAQPALAATPAGRAGALVRMDGMLLLGFGPRTPEAVLALHQALYPAPGG